jgi:peptidoglycan/LPS O-acetylase OafA/YrhL
MSNNKTTRERRHEVDWLRVYAVLLLIAIHTAAVFDPFPVTAVKGRSSLLMKGFAVFVHEWRLAVLFILSGAGAYFAFGYLSRTQFIRMRFRRIVIPLAFGTLFVVPVQLYYWADGLYPGRYQSYLDFYATMLSDAVHGRVWTKPEYLHWGHLWFLGYIFVISVVTVPLFLYLRGEGGAALASRLSRMLRRSGGIFLLALPLILSELLLRPRWPGYEAPNLVNDWANFASYLIYYVYGFLIYSDERIRRSVMESGKAALALALVTSTLFLAVSLSGMTPRTGYTVKGVLFLVLRGLNAWLWIVAILSFGMKRLAYNSRALAYLSEAAYPVYIIHLPIATAFAYYVVRWNVPVLAQFFLIVCSTVACSLAVYDLLVRRTKVTRFLFGLKPERRAGVAR